MRVLQARRTQVAQRALWARACSSVSAHDPRSAPRQAATSNVPPHLPSPIGKRFTATSSMPWRRACVPASNPWVPYHPWLPPCGLALPGWQCRSRTSRALSSITLFSCGSTVTARCSASSLRSLVLVWSLLRSASGGGGAHTARARPYRKHPSCPHVRRSTTLLRHTFRTHPKSAGAGTTRAFRFLSVLSARQDFLRRVGVQAQGRARCVCTAQRAQSAGAQRHANLWHTSRQHGHQPEQNRVTTAGRAAGGGGGGVAGHGAMRNGAGRSMPARSARTLKEAGVVLLGVPAVQEVHVLCSAAARGGEGTWCVGGGAAHGAPSKRRQCESCASRATVLEAVGLHAGVLVGRLDAHARPAAPDLVLRLAIMAGDGDILHLLLQQGRQVRQVDEAYVRAGREHAGKRTLLLFVDSGRSNQ